VRRRNRRPDGRRAKSLRSYAIDEAARVIGVHRNTVRHWIKNGLPVLDDRRPALILGSDLKGFLARQRKARRQPCQPGEIFCVKCRKPQKPDGAVADPVGPMNTEHKRRESALCGIDEILENRPLAMFSALHLKLLELLIAYWREAEVADEAEIKAPEPDLMQ
jgi:excisionase family DNA binding protein